MPTTTDICDADHNHDGAAECHAAMTEVRVFADRVLVGDRTYPRCTRAVGIARCTAPVLHHGADCGSHA